MSARDLRSRIAGLVLLVLLGAGLFVRVTNRAGESPKNPARAPVEVRAYQSLPVTETVCSDGMDPSRFVAASGKLRRSPRRDFHEDCHGWIGHCQHL